MLYGCREAIDLTPDNAILYGNRAAAGLMLGMYKAALQDSLTAVKLDPSYARGYHRVGKAYMTIGKFDEVSCSRSLPTPLPICLCHGMCGS